MSNREAFTTSDRQDSQALHLPRSKNRKSGRFVIRILLWAVLLLGLAELVLRFGLGLGTPVLITPDAACEYTLKPNQNVFRFFSHTRTNQHGMRSDEFAPAHDATSGLRVMFVGDSVTYGTSHVDQSNIFTEILHRELPAVVHRPVEVLNASAGAWAIDNELSYVRSRGIFGSDIVVLVLNSGDLTQPRATIDVVGDELPVKRPASAVSELYTRFIKPRIFHTKKRIDAGDAAVANADSVTRANLADLDSFREFVSSRGAAMAILYVPFRKDIPGVSAKSDDLLRAWTTANHVVWMDASEAESAHSSKEISLDGDHLSQPGNRVVADAVREMWPRVFPVHKD